MVFRFFSNFLLLFEEKTLSLHGKGDTAQCAVSPFHARFNSEWIRLLLLHSGIALAAVNRSVVGRLERNFRFLAALSASRGEELFLGLSGVLSGIAARLAALRLVLETALSVEFLLTGGENEFLSAIFAFQCLVFVHGFFLALRKI